MGFVQRWFTPSKSDNQSGAQYNAAYTAAGMPSAPSYNIGGAQDSVNAKRRKLSKTLLTGPEGLDTDFETTKKTLLGS